MRGNSAELHTIQADGPDARLFDAALKRTLEMLNADGGSIATRDDSRRVMVLRARQLHPRLQVDIRRSHPLQMPQTIDEENTTVLPASQLWRLYRPGERLIGYVWQSGEPVIMSGEEVRGLPGGTSPDDPRAEWHLAVPIFASLRGDILAPEEAQQVIGVIAVYVHNSQWPFTQQHLLLLQSQSQNLAQSLLLAHIARQELRNRRLLSLLQELTSNIPVPSDMDVFYETFFERIYVAISGMMDTEAFAVVLPRSMTTLTSSRPLDIPLTFYAVIEGGNRFPSEQLPEDQVPWWDIVRHGRMVGWMTDEDRRSNPYLRARTWGSQMYMDSQMYIPMKTASGVIGALLVASSRTNAYTLEHVNLLEMAGRFIALAIENTQMHRLQRIGGAPASESDRMLALLNNSLLGLNASLDVDVIIKDLVEQASELARGQVCVYLEYDKLADELIIRDAAQNKDHPYTEAYGQRIPVGTERRRLVVEGQTLPLDDLREEYRRGDIVGTLLERYHVQAMLLAPVIYNESVTYRNHVLGLLAIYSPDQRMLFAPSEEMNLMALGRVAASAIHNARTYAQLRELDRLKDEFILTASHEFRTPMSAIQGFSWLIQRRGESMTPEQGKHWAGEIIRATEQLKDMMDAITEAWRTKIVQMPSLEPVEVHGVVQLAIEISAGALGAESQLPVNTIPTDLWVIGEQDRLRHVISNLLTNAAKYSPHNSGITLSATVKTSEELLAMPRERGARDEDDSGLTINVRPDTGPWVVISVHDHGQGIPPVSQKKLFAKFVRLALTTNVRGTGLGLYICRRYIETMGGEIWVESMPGQGSTFSFCLPKTEPSAAQSS